MQWRNEQLTRPEEPRWRIAAKHEAMLCSVCRRPSAEELPEKPAKLTKGPAVPMMLYSYQKPDLETQIPTRSLWPIEGLVYTFPARALVSQACLLCLILLSQAENVSHPDTLACSFTFSIYFILFLCLGLGGDSLMQNLVYLR